MHVQANALARCMLNSVLLDKAVHVGREEAHIDFENCVQHSSHVFPDELLVSCCGKLHGPPSSEHYLLEPTHAPSKASQRYQYLYGRVWRGNGDTMSWMLDQTPETETIIFPVDNGRLGVLIFGGGETGQLGAHLTNLSCSYLRAA